MGLMKYTPNSKGVSELVTSTSVGGACRRAGVVIAEAARQTNLPTRRVTEDEKREYREAFNVTQTRVRMDKVKEDKMRAGAVVTNNYVKERLLGGKYHVLYNAVEAINGRQF